MGRGTRATDDPKTLMTEHGEVQIETPRDRDGSFEPQIVRKRQRRFEGSTRRSSRSTAAGYRPGHRGAPGRDLRRQGRPRPDLRVTDAVMDDARAWARGRWRTSTRSSSSTPGAEDPGGRHRPAPRRYLALGITRGRARRARPVVPGDRGRQVLDAGPHRAQAARRPRHPDLLRRRAQRVPRGDRGDLPEHHGPNVHRSSDPPP